MAEWTQEDRVLGRNLREWEALERELALRGIDSAPTVYAIAREAAAPYVAEIGKLREFYREARRVVDGFNVEKQPIEALRDLRAGHDNLCADVTALRKETARLSERCADLERENATLRRRNRVLDVVQADLATQHYGGDPQTLANTAESFAREARAALSAQKEAKQC